MEKLKQSLFQDYTIVLYADLNHGLAIPNLDACFSLESIGGIAGFSEKDVLRINEEFSAEKYFIDASKCFEKGAILWLLRSESKICGSLWSIRGRMVEPYYIPLTTNDIVIFDTFTFPDQRGKNINSILINHVMVRLRDQGATRVFGHVKIWNKPSIRALEKTPYRQLGLARKFHILGRDITIWYGQVWK
jgi:GNAT superfamily N-acetyltransferase